MLENLPNHIVPVFLLTTLLTFYLFVRAIAKTSASTTIVTLALVGWLAVQGTLGYTEFYTKGLYSTPPRFVLNILPPLLLMLVLFNTKKGKAFIDQLNLTDLTLISVVRIPVELVLLWLALSNTIPLGMTLEGWNFDIWSGITAPIIAFAYAKGKLSNSKLLVWNIIALTLVLTIVTQAILALPSPFQQLSFDQPNRGVLYFPFNWLPSFIVPVVFFCHFASIRQLIKR